MGMTSVEKILASHSGPVEGRKPGDVVVVDVDVAVCFDSMRPDVLKIADPDKLVLLHDHQVPAPTVQAANMAKQHAGVRREVRGQELLPRRAARHLPRAGGAGGSRPAGQDPGQRRLAHLLVGRPELPGPRHGPVGDDCTSSARARPGSWSARRPRSMLEGELPERVYARDIIHYIPGQYGDFAGRNLEWHGDGLASIGMDGRLTMATISAELSAEFSLFPYDDVLEEYLEGRAKWPFEPVHPDDDAEYEEVITVDLSSLEPQVVLPGQGRLELEAARRGGRAEGRPGVHRFVRQRPAQRFRRRGRDRQGQAGGSRGRGSS